MPADFSLPLTSTLYTTYLATLKERDVDALTLCVSDPSNIPTGAIKYNRASNKFQEYSGAAWGDKTLAIAGGGTGGATAAAARTALGLGSMAVQAANAVAITGGDIGTSVNIDASRLASGLAPYARLGTGGDGTGLHYLADDQTFKTLAAAFSTGMLLMFAGPSGSTPSGFLFCNGAAVSRTTYSTLFGIIGTTYGVGDGSTTFNIPDLRQRFPMGVAASGTGDALGDTGGAIDHTHSAGSHTHTVDSHTHTGPSHTHTGPSHSHAAGTLTGPSHTHAAGTLAGPSHTHFVTGETSGASQPHTHTYSATSSDTTSSGNFTTGAGYPLTASSHTHTVSGTTGNNSVDHFHDVDITSNAGGTGAITGSSASGGNSAVTGSTGAEGTAATGADGTGVTGGTGLTTNASGVGTTGTNNPPFLAVNFIIKT